MHQHRLQPGTAPHLGNQRRNFHHVRPRTDNIHDPKR
jgi:hypothetical protein